MSKTSRTLSVFDTRTWFFRVATAQVEKARVKHKHDLLCAVGKKSAIKAAIEQFKDDRKAGKQKEAADAGVGEGAGSCLA